MIWIRSYLHLALPRFPAEQARSLVRLGILIEEMLFENPREIFLIEGHTDAVGSEGDNLTLSDRRAESVALALTEAFRIPPENLIVQGYGEAYLKVQTQAAEERHRRVTLRRITPLLRQFAANSPCRHKRHCDWFLSYDFISSAR